MTSIHLHLQVLRLFSDDLSWMTVNAISLGWKSLLLLSYPLRPLLNWLVLLGAGISKIIIGQTWTSGMMLGYMVTQRPPIDMRNAEYREFSPKHSLLRHSGVYENEDAITAVGDWIAAQLKRK